MKPPQPNWGTPPWTISFRPKRKSLPHKVDFAIVGAGFSGLSAAAHLKRFAPNKSVIVLESGELGTGSSGRTGGMALADTAAGPLPGLGNVLAGYKKILRDLNVNADLHLPGAYELGRGKYSMEGKPLHPLPNSPIDWHDLGRLRAVNKVPGGTVNPGKVISGLAQAAQKAGVLIFQHAEVFKFQPGTPLKLTIRHNKKKHILEAGRILLATNALSLELTALHRSTEAHLTFALATEPLTKSQLKTLGLASRRPFYTVDFPYLWGRLFKAKVKNKSGDAIIFGAGLVPGFTPSADTQNATHQRRLPRNASFQLASGPSARSLHSFKIHQGQSADRLSWLEARVRNLHPILKNIRITHRWAGPILMTQQMRPVFRHHPKSHNVFILAGFNGHGVALSVYLGKWAAQSLLGKRPLPNWLAHTKSYSPTHR